jgi:hypothetical protein
MIVKKYKVYNLVVFNKDIRILASQLREEVRINKITFDNKNLCYVIELDASNKFHNELSKLGYTTI